MPFKRILFSKLPGNTEMSLSLNLEAAKLFHNRIYHVPLYLRERLGAQPEPGPVVR